MNFDPNNPVVNLCANGMAQEIQGNYKEALELFKKAWGIASNDFEKFTAAHYVARLQNSVEEKLEWDKLALKFALNINEEGAKSSYPSLYLNIGKCYEDLNDPVNALLHYKTALSFSEYLPQNEYGTMTKQAIYNGIERISPSNIKRIE